MSRGKNFNHKEKGHPEIYPIIELAKRRNTAASMNRLRILSLMKLSRIGKKKMKCLKIWKCSISVETLY